MLSFGFCLAKGFAEQGTEFVLDKAGEARAKAGKHSLKQLRQALEGSVARVHEKPDVDVTILRVDFQDGLDVDVFNFRLSGLKCRVRLEVAGSAGQLAAMVAADAAKGATKKVSKLLGGLGESLAQGIGELRDAVHSSVAEGEEVKSIEFDLNLDLGVRQAGEEVSAAVSIVGDALDQVDKIIPVKTATLYVEQAISDKVKEVISEWAKEQVRAKTGVDVDAAKALLRDGMQLAGLK